MAAPYAASAESKRRNDNTMRFSSTFGSPSAPHDNTGVGRKITKQQAVYYYYSLCILYIYIFFYKKLRMGVPVTSILNIFNQKVKL